MPKGSRTTPTLLTIHGETPGKVYELDRDSILIGRDLACDIVLSRKFVSRKHARIVRGPSGFEIEDLGSNCGTILEGERISDRVPLKDGHHIKIGNYLFVFNLPPVLVTDNDDSSSTIIGVLEAARPERAAGSAVHPEEKLRHVLEISRKLGESLQLDAVLEKTLETLFKIFPQADRGFVLLKEGETVDLTPRAIKFRGGETGSLAISRTILSHVLNEGKAILSSDAASDRRFEPSQSIVGMIRMMMCVPLLDPGRTPKGILQLDTREERGRFTQEDLDLLVAVASQVSVAVENARLHAALIEQTQIEQESQDAHEVQIALLPEQRPELPGYEFWDYYEPARYVGGDYFDYLPLAHADDQAEAPRRWLLAVADVAGKGMPAALLMARLSAVVRLFTLTMSDPARIVERLNRDLCHRATGERFITFLLVLVDAESHRLCVVSAGHSGPIIRRGDDRLEIVGEGQAGPPLGINEGAVYSASGVSIEPGDLVLLSTDGLIEAMDASGRCFGIDRVQQTFQGAPRGATKVGEAILRAVRRHASGCPQSDDITLLCFERLAPTPTPTSTST
jgi:serine phosphatase RsbU (regulator of sigma subunit)/pSer/pThr/pTyr-binding forkhead associated (FHA) protein